MAPPRCIPAFKNSPCLRGALAQSPVQDISSLKSISGSTAGPIPRDCWTHHPRRPLKESANSMEFTGMRQRLDLCVSEARSSFPWESGDNALNITGARCGQCAGVGRTLPLLAFVRKAECCYGIWRFSFFFFKIDHNTLTWWKTCKSTNGEGVGDHRHATPTLPK